jgi:hypothetical protein
MIAAAGLVGACLATSPLYAADLFGSAPPPMPDQAEQSELGSNWYIRGDVGYGVEKQTTVDPTGTGIIPRAQPAYAQDAVTGNVFGPLGYNFYDQPTGDASNPTAIKRGVPQTVSAMDFDIGAGYRVNDYLRLEATYGFHVGPGYSTQAQVVCPGKVTGVDNYYQTSVDSTGNPVYTATPIGYVYPATTCNGYLNSTQYNNTVLGSAYVDLGKWSIVTPYIGAGFGINASTITGGVNYYNTNDGSSYSGVTAEGDTAAPPTWVTQTGFNQGAGKPIYSYVVGKNGTEGPNVEFGNQNWNRTFNSTKFSFAAQLAAGLGIQISQSATLDLAYRYTTLDVSHWSDNVRQSVSVGVRYNLN